ncbi:uncharacterized protein F5147DRAFT_652964 [Suillus discolor]|uniref:Uncharacterized protein n=1 Tax=Suillus discolor TaxID=1912936 RepID=A0A9P7F8A2_9AGAM|nr:uncharacterized protein F5147DRAFT_652964 [Suillus discolor]KAG2108245.1 hypothetical protein F5147DRAFT_652964 [Suillus discolor]
MSLGLDNAQRNDDLQCMRSWRVVDDEYRPSPSLLATVRSPSVEVQIHAIAELTVEEITSRVMAQPLFWTSVWNNWSTLGVDQWLDTTVANFYLAHLWYEMNDTSHMRYVDVYTARMNHITAEEKELFKRNYFLPRERRCPMVPVGFIVHHSQYFFAVIFDYQQQRAHVLGRHISEDAMNVDGVDPHDWEDWGGPEYWRRIGDLHEWSLGDASDVSVITKDWMQNGLDCGPIACSVLKQYLASGINEGGNLPVFVVQCGHVLCMIAGHVKLSCSDYLMLLDSSRDDWREDELPDEHLINDIQNGRHQAKCLQLLQKLTVLSTTCQMCQRPIIRMDGDQQSNSGQDGHGAIVDEDGVDDEWNDDEDALGMALPPGRKETIAKLLQANIQLTVSRDRKAIVPCSIGTHLQLEPEIPPDLNVAYTGRRWLQDDRKFDDYEDGPTIEMLSTSRDISRTMTVQAGGLKISTAWVDWVNHGYHITPGSFHIFYQCDPIATMDHIMPIGTTDSYDSANQVPDRVTGAYSLARRGSAQAGGQNTEITDVEIMSASELIDSVEYDPPLNDACRFGHKFFVCGCTSLHDDHGPALYVDLERDAVQFSEDDIEILVDIDSIIWTTKVFRCKGSVGIYITPPFQTKPGIFKHNHTYVDILIPQSEEDARAPGGRTEWLSKRFPMSAIPHACIGQISSASSTLNLYIAFPRMIHTHLVNGRRITLMPKDVLDIFWDRVLLPSIENSTDVSWVPYIKHTLEEARYKDVQACMEDCVHDGESELSMFGSFFFILKGKGIKLLTKDGQRGRFSGPEEALCRNLSDLDWTYMINRKHGELLVDVGISFTPHSTDIPVIGLWRLDALEALFGAGGFKRGEIHHHNTLSRYGALQAEMQQERSQQMHIAFRSTYNLYYKSIRTNSNQGNFASDSDAYKLSPSYMTECFKIAKPLDGCKDKMYGVRDEYRVSGHVAKIILDNIDIKAKEYLQSDPILWIPSKIWFELIRRHVREIQRTQISIVKKNPPNLSILTGVLNHMLRSTTSTPIIYDSHTAGMFFLQDFNLGSETCLEEVQQIDDVNVLALMGVNAKDHRNRAVERIDSWKNTGSEEDYPLAVGRLIVMFTRQTWLMLMEDVLKGIRPYPNNLKEAMKCWMTTSIDDTLASVAFEVCNAGLQDNRGVTPGRMSPRSRAFGDRSVMFFPDPEASYRNNTQWSLLWDGDGYITEFHRTIKTMDCYQQATLKQGLRDVFSELHCLPASGARVWTQKNNAIVFTTNPAFYRIHCVGRAGESQRKVIKGCHTMKLIKGKRIFAADLMDFQPFDVDENRRRKTERQKCREIQKKMTMTRKNKRVPPPLRPRMSRPFPMDVQEDLEDDVAMDID